MLGNFYYETAIGTRHCICSAKIKPGEKYLAESIPTANDPKRVNYCAKCAREKIAALKIELKQIKLRVLLL